MILIVVMLVRKDTPHLQSRNVGSFVGPWIFFIAPGILFLGNAIRGDPISLNAYTILAMLLIILGPPIVVAMVWDRWDHRRRRQCPNAKSRS